MVRLWHRATGDTNPHARLRSAARVALDEPLQDLRRLEDPAAACHLLDRLGLVRLEVAGVLVDVDPGAQPVDVELGVELRGVDVATHAERLDRAPGRRGEVYGVRRQVADGLLVAHEGLELLWQVDQERVGPSCRGQPQRAPAYRLGVRAIDRAALVDADDPDAVTGPEEGEVEPGHLVEEVRELG